MEPRAQVLEPPPDPPRTAFTRAREIWRRRRLDLGGLSPGVRLATIAGLGTCVIGGVLIVVLGARWRLPFGIQPPIDVGSRSMPRLAVLFCYLGMGVGAVLLVESAGRKAEPARRLLFLAVALVGASLAAETILAAPSLRAFRGSHPLLPEVLGWTGIGTAALLAFAPNRLTTVRSWIRPAVAAAPFVLWAAAYLATTGRELQGVAQVLPPAEHVYPRDVVAQAAVVVIANLGIGLAVLALWSAMQSSRLARDLGLGVVALARRVPRVVDWIVVAAVALKVVVLGIGYTGALPGWVDSASFSESLHNGAAGWVIAGLLAAAFGVWLGHGRERAVPEAGYTGAAWSLVVGFLSAFLAATAVFMLVFLALLLPFLSPARWLLHAGQRLLNLDPARFPPTLWAIVGTVVLASVIGAVRFWLGRRTAVTFFLLAITIWCLPRALGLAWRLVTHHLLFTNASIVTMDAAVTVVVAVLLAMWYAGRQRAAPPEILLFVLVVSTLIARPGVVLPTAWTTGILFYLALAFPVAYQFLLGAEELNERGEGRSGKVLWEVGISCALLTIAVLEVAAKLTVPGGVDPLTLYLQDVARFFLTVPFAGFLVATAVSAWRTQAGPGPGDRQSVEADASASSAGRDSTRA